MELKFYKVFTICFFLVSYSFCTTKQYNIDTAHKDKIKDAIPVAILNVENQTNFPCEYSRLARDCIEAEFTTYPEYIVVDRIELDKISNEQKISQSGLTNDELIKMGKLLNAKRIVSSRLSIINTILVLSGRLIDLETGKVIESATGRVSQADKIDGAAKGLSRRLTGRMRK